MVMSGIQLWTCLSTPEFVDTVLQSFVYVFYSGQRFEYTYGHKGHNSGISVFFELVQPVLVFKVL